MSVDYAISKTRIAAVRQEFKRQRFAASFRDRGGKQYLRVVCKAGVSTAACVDIFDQFGIIYAFHTSGGGTEHTFRLNPEKEIRDHLDDMRQLERHRC